MARRPAPRRAGPDRLRPDDPVRHGVPAVRPGPGHRGDARRRDRRDGRRRHPGRGSRARGHHPRLAGRDRHRLPGVREPGRRRRGGGPHVRGRVDHLHHLAARGRGHGHRRPRPGARGPRRDPDPPGRRGPPRGLPLHDPLVREPLGRPPAPGPPRRGGRDLREARRAHRGGQSVRADRIRRRARRPDRRRPPGQRGPPRHDVQDLLPGRAHRLGARAGRAQARVLPVRGVGLHPRVHVLADALHRLRHAAGLAGPRPPRDRAVPRAGRGARGRGA
ncbi:Uncharacterised protein [Streptococcus pneumoniae]|nr:Uncharacterised protein [Streptococcus pneumoniae]